jgi:uncharacterized membrane protein YfcA
MLWRSVATTKECLLEFYYLTLLGGAFFAAFVVGAAGFGDALFAAAFWLHIMAPGEAIPLIVMAGIVIHGLPFLRLYKQLDFSRLWRFMLPGLVCVPVGVWLLQSMSAEPFKITVGTLLIAYGVLRLSTNFSRLTDFGGPRWDIGIGAIGGILGGLAGLSGVIVTIWCNTRSWPKARQRGVFQPFALAMHAMAVATFAWQGQLSRDIGMDFLIILPAIFLGSWAGLKVYGRLDEQRFTQVILVLLLVSGAALLI